MESASLIKEPFPKSSGRVLLLDDELSVLLSLKRRMRNFDVFAAADAANARRLFKETSKIDVVVADYHMPGEDGISFLRWVKENYPNTVRIMLSGNGAVDVLLEAINDVGVDKFLSKPCDAATLTENILQLLNRRQLSVSENEHSRDNDWTGQNNSVSKIQLFGEINASMFSDFSRRIKTSEGSSNLKLLAEFKNIILANKSLQVLVLGQSNPYNQYNTDFEIKEIAQNSMERACNFLSIPKVDFNLHQSSGTMIPSAIVERVTIGLASALLLVLTRSKATSEVNIHYSENGPNKTFTLCFVEGSSYKTAVWNSQIEYFCWGLLDACLGVRNVEMKTIASTVC